jgi:hypothetical protein
VYRESSSSRQKHRIGSIFWGFLALVIGWIPFVYWWREVILREEIRVFASLVIWLTAAVVILTIATSLWIVHNQRIARRGNRGLATRFFTLEHVSDRLGRSLVTPGREALRSSSRIIVRADGNFKIYAIAECEASR